MRCYILEIAPDSVDDGAVQASTLLKRKEKVQEADD